MNEGSACAEKEEEVKITSLLRGYCIEMSHATLHYIAMTFSLNANIRNENNGVQTPLVCIVFL